MLAEILSALEMVCATPVPTHIHTGTSLVYLQICKDGVHCAEGSMLTISVKIFMHNASPLNGFIESGTNVQFSMKYNIGPHAKCRFGYQLVDIVATNASNAFHCLAPAVVRPHKV